MCSMNPERYNCENIDLEGFIWNRGKIPVHFLIQQYRSLNTGNQDEWII
ncbi:MAG: hypothetical protein ACKN9E_16365 [Microcystaceae cyanobacterium]